MSLIGSLIYKDFVVFNTLYGKGKQCAVLYKIDITTNYVGHAVHY